MKLRKAKQMLVGTSQISKRDFFFSRFPVNLNIFSLFSRNVRDLLRWSIVRSGGKNE